MRVFVLIFNSGTDNEGIHTVRIRDTAGVIRNQIMLFESEDDATRYALMLEAQDFPSPSVEMMNAEEIKAFCQESGYDWEMIPANGNLILPPEINMEETDWQSAAAEESAEELDPDDDLNHIRRQLEGLL
jgi:hypothetical protein